jgi:insulysin
MNAVQSEYNMGAMQDRRRLWYVEQAIVNSTGTPFSRFSCGNLTTLADVNSTTVRNWFNAEYDPRGMHLVVFSNEPMQVLERRVEARFSDIKFSESWKGPVRADVSGVIVPTSVLSSWVYVEPIKDVRTLRMMWSLPPRFGARGNRVGDVAASVLEGSGPGSILSNLKDEGLASSFSASSENDASDAAFFYTNTALTVEGLANVTRVVQLIFQGIGSLGKQTLPAWIVEEHNQMSTLNYMWQTRKTNYRDIAIAAYNLRQEDLAGYPRKSLIWEYSPFDLLDIFLTHLTPNKSIIFVQGRSSDTFNVTFDSSEPIAGARYSLVNISDADMNLFVTAHDSLQQQNYYPPPSPFMPNPPPQVLYQIDPFIASNLQKWEPNPEPITLDFNTDPAFRNTYLAPDMEFGVPRLVLKTSFFSPALDFAGDPRKEVIGYLWMSQVLETTEQWSSQAAAGGFQFPPLTGI